MPNRKLILRGAQIRHVDLRVSEGNCIARMHVSCDITQELAAEMGWEIYSGGHLISGLAGATKLSGDLYLDKVSLQLNGLETDGFECSATTADSFELSRSKGETDGSIETQLRFRLLSTSWEPIAEFYGQMGQADGVMHLHRLPEQTRLQQTLDEQDQEDSENEEDEEEAAPPPPKQKGRPKKAAASTITVEAVQ